MSFDAVILAGGAARRLGGIDKAAVTIGDETLLDRVLAAATDATQIICVGPKRPTSVSVEWTLEDPAGGGPVAALAAGLALVETPVVAVLAVDLPFVTRSVVGRLVGACEADGAALVVDRRGVPQPLLAAYATEALRQRLQAIEDPSGVSMRWVLEDIPYALVDEPGVSHDCDTWADVELARRGTRI